ncbi:MAG: flavin reductase family protein [Fimbriimonadaceae bacterium]|nr:flavin reductase family protein [Fimbriimonadaceae bacterium]
MSTTVAIDPADLTVAATYDFLSRVVVPRPIALVSTLADDGTPNLAPFSFFMAGGANPASLVFCPVRAVGGRKKDTLANIEATGEYVINLVDRAMAEAMNATSAKLPPEASEWEHSGFLSAPSVKVAPARVAASPVSFEMKLFRTLDHGTGDTSATYVVGEVVLAHVHESVWNDGTVQALQPIARLGGPSYIDLVGGQVFDLVRPKAPGPG